MRGDGRAKGCHQCPVAVNARKVNQGGASGVAVDPDLQGGERIGGRLGRCFLVGVHFRLIQAGNSFSGTAGTAVLLDQRLQFPVIDLAGAQLGNFSKMFYLARDVEIRKTLGAERGADFIEL